VRIGVGISTSGDGARCAADACRRAGARLGGAGTVDLAIVFASGAHLRDPERVLEAVRAELDPAALVGCGAGGVLGEEREVESADAVAVWAASLEGGAARPFHVSAGAEGEVSASDLPAPRDGSLVVVLADPYSYPSDALLDELARAAPGVAVLGGLSSARLPERGAVLFCGDEVHGEGAVGVVLDGVQALPCVSQGAAPLGPEMTITAAEGNLIHELAGRPALAAIEHAIAQLPLSQRMLVASGLLVGIVIDPARPEYERGDFLVRGVLGADERTGAVAVGATVAPGQVVRLHARDAASADEDLRSSLRLRLRALGSEPPAGALIFSCNGRGRAMFGVADHDARVVGRELAGAPAAGFFAAGEIGPVGGRSFLHGFTATLAIFAR